MISWSICLISLRISSLYRPHIVQSLFTNCLVTLTLSTNKSVKPKKQITDTFITFKKQIKSKQNPESNTKTSVSDTQKGIWDQSEDWPYAKHHILINIFINSLNFMTLSDTMKALSGWANWGMHSGLINSLRAHQYRVILWSLACRVLSLPSVCRRTLAKK